MKYNTRWLPLFATNFFGVFNNNYFKLLIITISVRWFPESSDIGSYIVSLASGLFFASYIFLSPLAGRLSKIMYKKKIIIYSRFAEFPVYITGAIGFYLENIYIVLACMLLLGTVSTLFSPAKYGLIRDIGGEKGISFGTGTLEMLTFFGNIAGPLVAALIADYYDFRILAGILIGVSVISFITIFSLKVNESEPMKNNTETINPYLFLIRSYKWAKSFKGMNLIVLGLGIFWMIDAVLQMNLFVHCPGFLKLSNTGMGIIMAVALGGIGLGSFSAGIISRGKVELMLVPVAGACMSVCLLLLYIIQPVNVYIFAVFIFLIAMFSGICMIPLSAYIQAKIEGRKQSDMIAYSNFVTFILLFAASGLFGIAADKLGTNTVFLIQLFIVATMALLLLLFVPEIRNRFKIKK